MLMCRERILFHFQLNCFIDFESGDEKEESSMFAQLQQHQTASGCVACRERAKESTLNSFALTKAN